MGNLVHVNFSKKSDLRNELSSFLIELKAFVSINNAQKKDITINMIRSLDSFMKLSPKAKFIIMTACYECIKYNKHLEVTNKEIEDIMKKNIKFRNLYDKKAIKNANQKAIIKKDKIYVKKMNNNSSSITA